MKNREELELELEIERFRCNIILDVGLLSFLIIMFLMVLINGSPISVTTWCCCGISTALIIGLVIYSVIRLIKCYSELDDLIKLDDNIKLMDELMEAVKKENNVIFDEQINTIQTFVCSVREAEDNLILDVIMKDIKEHPEIYGTLNLVEISREKIKDLLSKGAAYDNLEHMYYEASSNEDFYKSERDNLDRTLEELREACDDFLNNFKCFDALMNAYNIDYAQRFGILKNRIKEFEDEINGEGA